MKNISFIIATAKDELEYLKLLLTSLYDNLSHNNHEILVFIASDNQGTHEYLLEYKKTHTNLVIIKDKTNSGFGPQINNDILIKYATNDIISFLHSDMVVSKDYDIGILNNIEQDCVLSCTRIEPPLHGESPYTFTYDFGKEPNTFTHDKFQEYAETVKSDKQLNYFFAPYSFYKQTWYKVGGYDSIFRRSREDSDFVQRCLHHDIKLKQTFESNVYHFTCVSSRGKDWFNERDYWVRKRNALQQQADKIELSKFIRKWGAFNHGDEKLYKYDIDLVIPEYLDGYTTYIFPFEPYFSRIWFSTEQFYNELLDDKNKEEHVYANKLLGLTEEEWDNMKKLYNTTNYNDIIKLGNPIQFNCKIEAIGPISRQSYDFIRQIHKIIEHYEPGIYEYAGFKLTIINKVVTSHINITNPEFDYSLLEISK